MQNNVTDFSKIFISPEYYIIEQNVPLRDKNWFGTGGPARFYAAPIGAGQMTLALECAQEYNLPIFVLGQGANILISDQGFNGLVIHPQDGGINLTPLNSSEILVHVDAGVIMHDLINFCLEHSIIGLEEFSGIPGTVGGSVYINLHYFEFLLEQFLDHAQVIDKKTLKIHTVNKEWFKFGYNQSTLQEKNHYLISATFKLKQASLVDVAFARGRREEIIRHRYQRYPYTGTCGSFFRNFHPQEVSMENNGKKVIWVAYYLDKIGVKGQLACGGAQVSHQHANMIVNKANATSADIITLARTMQELVHKNFGIMPQPECQLIGFNHYPLHT
jgi:UDP-N-acetylmuramate dehydrogenase